MGGYVFDPTGWTPESGKPGRCIELAAHLGDCGADSCSSPCAGDDAVCRSPLQAQEVCLLRCDGDSGSGDCIRQSVFIGKLESGDCSEVEAQLDSAVEQAAQASRACQKDLAAAHAATNNAVAASDTCDRLLDTCNADLAEEASQLRQSDSDLATCEDETAYLRKQLADAQALMAMLRAEKDALAAELDEAANNCTTTTTQRPVDPCAVYTCGAYCQRAEGIGDGTCGWSTGLGMCKSGQTTTVKERTAGDCSLTPPEYVPASTTTSTSTSSPVVGDACALIACVTDCAEAVGCGWVSSREPAYCKQGAGTSKAEILQYTASTCQGTTPDACGKLTCVRDCYEAPGCGWQSKNNVCVEGKETKLRDLRNETLLSQCE